MIALASVVFTNASNLNMAYYINTSAIIYLTNLSKQFSDS